MSEVMVRRVDRCISDRRTAANLITIHPVDHRAHGGLYVCSCQCGKTWWEGDNFERNGGQACERCCTGTCQHEKWREP